MGLLLSGTCPGPPGQPLKLRAQYAPALPLAGLLHIQTLFLKLDIFTVASGIAVHASSIYLYDPSGYPVEKIAVVGQGDDRSLNIQQKVLTSF